MSKKLKLFLIFAVALILLGTSISFAFLFNFSNEVSNKFGGSKIYEPVILEDFANGDLIKRNVKIDVSSYEYYTYVRVKIIINWQNDEGKILTQMPKSGEDYNIVFRFGNWLLGEDGYYYYLSPLDGVSDVLIEECQLLSDSPVDGYRLNVDIIAETVQSEPRSAVSNVWNVTLDSQGNIVL